VISAQDARDIYYVPSLMEKEGLSDYLMEKLKLTSKEETHEWEELMKKMAAIDKEIRIGVVGKYAHLGDSYISINEALKHAGIECQCRIKIDWIDAEEFERNRIQSIPCKNTTASLFLAVSECAGQKVR